mgnify:CR=1 FL=1
MLRRGGLGGGGRRAGVDGHILPDGVGQVDNAHDGAPFRLFLVYVQLQHIGAGVVAYAVQLHAAGGYLLHVQIGVDNGLPVPHRLRRLRLRAGRAGLELCRLPDFRGCYARQRKQEGHLYAPASAQGCSIHLQKALGISAAEL